jgi:hypothetical protein
MLHSLPSGHHSQACHPSSLRKANFPNTLCDVAPFGNHSVICFDFTRLSKLGSFHSYLLPLMVFDLPTFLFFYQFLDFWIFLISALGLVKLAFIKFPPPFLL